MKRIVRLTESDLTRIVRRVINEQKRNQQLADAIASEMNRNGYGVNVYSGIIEIVFSKSRDEIGRVPAAVRVNCSGQVTDPTGDANSIKYAKAVDKTGAYFNAGLAYLPKFCAAEGLK